jgi:hypothetical protein
MKKNVAVANRTRPDRVILMDFFRKDAVNGQAETPENNANHPFVSGRGPRVRRRTMPPPPARIDQAQANIQPT